MSAHLSPDALHDEHRLNRVIAKLHERLSERDRVIADLREQLAERDALARRRAATTLPFDPEQAP